MADNKDVEKILRDIKIKKNKDGNIDFIKKEVPVENIVQQPQQPQIDREDDMLAKLAGALKENGLDTQQDEDHNAPGYVDDKFVDFFTQSIAVIKDDTPQVKVKRKKNIFFKKKYITDSLTLNIPQEDIDKAQSKPSKQPQPKNDTQAEVKKEKGGLFGFGKSKSQPKNETESLSALSKADENLTDEKGFAASQVNKVLNQKTETGSQNSVQNLTEKTETAKPVQTKQPVKQEQAKQPQKVSNTPKPQSKGRINPPFDSVRADFAAMSAQEIINRALSQTQTGAKPSEKPSADYSAKGTGSIVSYIKTQTANSIENSVTQQIDNILQKPKQDVLKEDLTKPAHTENKPVYTESRPAQTESRPVYTENKSAHNDDVKNRIESIMKKSADGAAVQSVLNTLQNGTAQKISSQSEKQPEANKNQAVFTQTSNPNTSQIEKQPKASKNQTVFTQTDTEKQPEPIKAQTAVTANFVKTEEKDNRQTGNSFIQKVENANKTSFEADKKDPDEIIKQIKKQKPSYLAFTLDDIPVPKQEQEEEKPKVIFHTKENIFKDDTTGYIDLQQEEESKPQETPESTKNITSIFDNISDDYALEEDEEESAMLEEDSSYPEFSADPAEIVEELKNFKFTLSIRMGISFITSLVLLYFASSAKFALPVPPFADRMAQPMLFYLMNLVFFAIAVIGFLPTIANGITGFFKKPTPDSFLVMPTIWALLQLNTAILFSDSYDVKSPTLLACFVCIAYGFNALGKSISAGTILKNLSLSQVPEGINAGYSIKNYDDVKRLARTLDEKDIHIMVSRKTGYISNFISGGFSSHNSEKYSRILSIVNIAVSFVCFFIATFTKQGLYTAVSAAMASSVLTLPLSHCLISAVPSSLMQKSLRKVGALVNGWYGIYQLCGTTHICFDAKYLFPKGSVVLHGIKTFEKERLDLAILYAASIAVEKCDNLRSVFLNVIDGKTDILFPVENCQYKVGQGYVAWIDNNRVIMGNRSIMDEYEIELPPISTERKYTVGGKRAVYLSVNGKLFGMFVVSYHPDGAIKESLDSLIDSGKSIIFQSNDFNVDSELLSDVYALPLDMVQVLNKNETTLLSSYTQYAESTDCAMAHLDSLHSLTAAFLGAESAGRATKTCSFVQILNVVMGCVFSIVFTVSSTLWIMPTTSLIMLSLGWVGLCLMRAFAVKYY